MNSMTPPTSKDATNRYEWKELDVVPNVEEATKDNRSSLPFLQSFDDIVSDINIPAFLHNHKATLRFPETAERDGVRSGTKPATGSLMWTPDGKAIVVRDTRYLINKLLPLANSSGQAKFSSFVRRLYRWGFRQASGTHCDRNDLHSYQENIKEKVFCHPLFQRDNKPLIEGMKSITAAGTRRAIAERLMDIQESQLLERGPSQEHMQSLDQPSLSTPNSLLVAAVPRTIGSHLLGMTAMTTTSPARLLSTGAHGISPSSLGSNHPFLPPDNLFQDDDIRFSMILSNSNRQGSMAPAGRAPSGPLLPFHTPAGYLRFSSDTPSANIISLLMPDLVEPNFNERNLAVLDEILGDSCGLSRRETLLRSILRQGEQF